MSNSAMMAIMSAGAGRRLKNYRRTVEKINGFSDAVSKLSDDELGAKTTGFKERIEKGESLSSILPEAFAVVREASERVLGLRQYDEQLIAGMVLNDGAIAEAATGSGKTLSAVAPTYLNALGGKGVHIVTVNDYLAQRDSEQMGEVYSFLGLTTGLILPNQPNPLKRAAYECDVTYGTNNEFGFDYLRDNMVRDAAKKVQRGHHYAIVDEVDSILIDEARTPLIISGEGDDPGDIYYRFAEAVRGLEEGEQKFDPDLGMMGRPTGDFVIDYALRNIMETERGADKISERLGFDVYADESGRNINLMRQALKAEYMFKRDKDYIVSHGEVEIVDEFTGRVLKGRRWSDGLHQAVEAKEGVRVHGETLTMATITLQNYFRMYDKLAGMTGTAATEGGEFAQTYHMDVVVVPDHKKNIRADGEDKVYLTMDEKFKAVTDDVERRHEKGQPCLVGTVSVGNSERLSRMFTKRGIPHQVLNAKQDAREAAIVAQAGRYGAVTIATNMAGRGTDILLGGNPSFMALERARADGVTGDNAEVERSERYRSLLKYFKWSCDKEHDRVAKAGGLAVIGTQRHESRRIDNQLRGRAGRQGDPGESQFYLSLDDELMQRFGGERMDRLRAKLRKAGVPEDEPVLSNMVTRAISRAQQSVEGADLAARTDTLEYDDVMNEQRRAIYARRDEILTDENPSDVVDKAMVSIAVHMVDKCCPVSKKMYDWDLDDLKAWLAAMTGREDCPDFMHVRKVALGNAGNPRIHSHKARAAVAEAMRNSVTHYLQLCYKENIEGVPDGYLDRILRDIMLTVIDNRWSEYLSDMDYMRTGINLRGFAQRDPKSEYREEAYRTFGELVWELRQSIVTGALRMRVTVSAPLAPMRMVATGPTPTSVESHEIPTEDDWWYTEGEV